MNSIVCPISVEMIDSNVSRLTVFLNALLMGLFLATRQPAFLAIVALDYLVRAAFRVEYSPIRFLAIQILSPFKLNVKPTGLAPKIFASRLGLLCAVAGLLLFLNGFTVASSVVISMFLVLAALDSLFDLCVGCMIYNYLVYPFYKNQ